MTASKWTIIDKVLKVTGGIAVTIMIPLLFMVNSSYTDLKITMVKINSELKHNKETIKSHVKDDGITSIADVREAMRDS